jgi:outer membrane murein-binding lipoprotein Lpp
MENTMKKIYVAAVAAIAVSVLAGCSQNASAPTAPPTAATDPSAAQVQALQNDPRISPKMKAAIASGKPAGN